MPLCISDFRALFFLLYTFFWSGYSSARSMVIIPRVVKPKRQASVWQENASNLFAASKWLFLVRFLSVVVLYIKTAALFTSREM